MFASPDGNSWAPLRGVNANGGIAYGNYLFLAASGADVYSSTNAVTWTRTPVPLFENSFSDLAFGNGQFVAAFYRGGIATSTNGIAWRGISPARVESLSFGGGIFVAVGYSGTIIASLDATTWIQRDSGTTNNLLGIGYGGGVYVAVGSAGTILTSTDATTWTPRTSGVTNDLTAVAYGSGRFVVVGANATILQSGPVMHLGGFHPLSSGAVQFTLSGPAGQFLELQTSTDLADWVVLTGIKLTEPSATFVIISPTNFNQRFYRSVVP
jgi:hypothetical protein